MWLGPGSDRLCVRRISIAKCTWDTAVAATSSVAKPLWIVKPIALGATRGIDPAAVGARIIALLAIRRAVLENISLIHRSGTNQ